MKIMFIEGPPFINWTGSSKLTTGGRRHPSLCESGETTYSYLNLSAAAVLRESGHEVEYIHCQTDGIDLKGVEKNIGKSSPDMVVCDVQHVRIPVEFKIAEMAKKCGAVSVFVGYFAAAAAEKLLKNCKHLDFVCTKEYDFILRDLADALERKKPISYVKGIKYRKGVIIKETKPMPLIEDLDELPIPAYDLVQLDKFYESVFLRLPSATAITARGCPFRCFFCAFPNTLYSHEFRSQSPARVIEEAKYLSDEFGIREIRYDDDTFEVNKKRVFEICDKFKEEKLDLIWNTQNRPGLMTPDLCRRMKEAGCVRMMFGAESGDDDILKKMNKGTTVEEIERGEMYARKAGIILHNCFMFGFPWDTMETMKKTIGFACKLNAEFTQFSIATPLPGTPFYDMMKSQGLLIGEDWERDSFHAASIKTFHLTPDQVNSFFNSIRRKYYFRPAYFWLTAKQCMKSYDYFKQTLRLVPNLLRHEDFWGGKLKDGMKCQVYDS